MPETGDDLADQLPEFNWLERRADGLLIFLTFALVLLDALLVWWAPGVLLSWLVFVGGGVLAGWVGLEYVGRLGKPFVGGMFLGRFLRWLFLVMLVVAIVVGIGICLLAGTVPGPSRPGVASHPGVEPWMTSLGFCVGYGAG